MKKIFLLSALSVLVLPLSARPNTPPPGENGPHGYRPSGSAPVERPSTFATVTHPVTQNRVVRPQTQGVVHHPVTNSAVSRPTTFSPVNRPETQAPVHRPQGHGPVSRPGTYAPVFRPGLPPMTGGHSYTPSYKQAKDFSAPPSPPPSRPAPAAASAEPQMPPVAALNALSSGLGINDASGDEARSAAAAASNRPKAESSQVSVEDVLKKTNMPAGFDSMLKQRNFTAEKAASK